MKKLLFLTFLAVSSYANINDIKYFKADFTQSIVDDQNKTIEYLGHVQAAKPQYALWEYKTPINKQVYILPNKVVIIEPELEQAIIKKITGNFDFFSLIKNAKRIGKDDYVANFNNTKYDIKLVNGIIESISYKDEFENNVKILFAHQVENIKYKKKIFTPTIPKEYDIISE
ncbi:LolA-like outer membrane lipoprotein chaperone [Sulfurimonas sp.]